MYEDLINKLCQEITISDYDRDLLSFRLNNLNNSRNLSNEIKETVLKVDELYKILDAQPDNYDAYYDLAKVNFELGNYDVAIENFENVLNYKENEWVYFYLAEAYEANNEIDKAISNYLKAIAHKSDFIPAYKKVAILFLARGDREDAIEYFEDYLSMDIAEEEKKKISELVERIKKTNVER